MLREGAHILVADDESHVVHILARALTAEGYRVTGCLDGREALVAARRDRPDLIITDALMPEMSGGDLIAALGSSGATAEVPIIILTARGSTVETQAAQFASVRQICSKPFSARSIVKLVSAVLAGASSGRGQWE